VPPHRTLRDDALGLERLERVRDTVGEPGRGFAGF
jgi:hypothetical protein